MDNSDGGEVLPFEVRGGDDEADWLIEQELSGELVKLNKPDEDALAKEFSRKFPDWRYTEAWKRWHHWDGDRKSWVEDSKLGIYTLMRDLIISHTEQGDKFRNSSHTHGAISLARSNRGVGMDAESWDSHKMHLGTPDGVVDLETGELVDDPKPYYITQQTAVAPAPPGTPHPLWDRLLSDICEGHDGLYEYIQKIAGYGLTGSDAEQQLFFAWGNGANGKGAFWNTIQRLMGSYGHVANHDLLLATNGVRHPTDLASLRGKRFTIASELPHNAKWDEQRLKSITGGDTMSARVMRGDFFNFTLQLTLVVFANHKPSIDSVDESVRRRIRLLPFTNTVPPEKRDKHLPKKLEPEWPAILRWMIDGCMKWQAEGLDPPKCVVQASEEYMRDNDTLGQFIEANFERCDESFVTRQQLRDRWRNWVLSGEGAKWSATQLYEQFRKAGYKDGKSVGERGFRGLRLRVLSMDEL